VSPRLWLPRWAFRFKVRSSYGVRAVSNPYASYGAPPPPPLSPRSCERGGWTCVLDLLNITHEPPSLKPLRQWHCIGCDLGSLRALPTKRARKQVSNGKFATARRREHLSAERKEDAHVCGKRMEIRYKAQELYTRGELEPCWLAIQRDGVSFNPRASHRCATFAAAARSPQSPPHPLSYLDGAPSEKFAHAQPHAAAGNGSACSFWHKSKLHSMRVADPRCTPARGLSGSLIRSPHVRHTRGNNNREAVNVNQSQDN
jgi:hypothetical protein